MFGKVTGWWLGSLLLLAACGPTEGEGNEANPTLTPDSVTEEVDGSFTLTWTLNSQSAIVTLGDSTLEWVESATTPAGILESDFQTINGIDSTHMISFTCRQPGMTQVVMKATIVYDADKSMKEYSRTTNVTCNGDVSEFDAAPPVTFVGPLSLVRMRGAAFAVAAGTLVVGDDSAEALFSVDSANQKLAVVADSVVGSGPAITKPTDLAQIDTDTVLVADTELNAILSVDLDTGDRTVISDASTGAGAAFVKPLHAVYDGANDRALVAEAPFGGTGAIVDVDMATGDRTVLSGPGVGSGDPMQGTGMNGLTYDAANNRVFLMVFTKLIEVNLGSGIRTVVSASDVGSGPEFSVPVSVSYDGTNNRVLVVDRDLDALIFIDLATGNRTVLSDASNGAGQAFDRPVDAELDVAAGRAFVVDSLLEAVLEVDLSSGDRAIYAQ